MDGKNIALASLTKSYNDLEQSLDITFNGVRKEFDDINEDLDLAFSENRRLKRLNKELANRVNWLIAFTAGNTTIILLAVLSYFIFRK